MTASPWSRVLLHLLLLVLLTGSQAAPTAVEINTANQAELEQLKGIGVAMSERVLQARAQAPFADWADLMARVPGLGQRTAKRLSEQGLTVQGRAYPVADHAAPGAGKGPVTPAP